MESSLNHSHITETDSQSDETLVSMIVHEKCQSRVKKISKNPNPNFQQSSSKSIIHPSSFSQTSNDSYNPIKCSICTPHLLFPSGHPKIPLSSKPFSNLKSCRRTFYNEDGKPSNNTDCSMNYHTQHDCLRCSKVEPFIIQINKKLKNRMLQKKAARAEYNPIPLKTQKFRFEFPASKRESWPSQPRRPQRSGRKILGNLSPIKHNMNNTRSSMFLERKPHVTACSSQGNIEEKKQTKKNNSRVKQKQEFSHRRLIKSNESPNKGLAISTREYIKMHKTQKGFRNTKVSREMIHGCFDPEKLYSNKMPLDSKGKLSSLKLNPDSPLKDNRHLMRFVPQKVLKSPHFSKSNPRRAVSRINKNNMILGNTARACSVLSEISLISKKIRVNPKRTQKPCFLQTQVSTP
ncbi:unnamed protein product [Moneuplotes crassus]|uniref:Uncharacterized protein n=1 Tax=Euplotes crassus TaxID=5936 RepID=A0AAD1YAY7_EUPCR|nr:unnamed protein product [Moneuplotes crassus]